VNFIKQSLMIFILILLGTTALVQTAFAEDAERLFGSGGGYIHPSLTIGADYTDNYTQVASHEESEWTTTISPQLFVSVPSSDQTFGLTSLNAAPGGAGSTNFMGDAPNGYQAMFLYRADIERHADFSEDDTVSHNAQGLLQYAFAGGLTLAASDVYLKSYDSYAEVGIERSEYASNLASVSAHYQLSPKTAVQVGYANYLIDYDSSRQRALERTDETVSASLYYRILPKTQLFLQYEEIDVDYDLNQISDSRAHNYFVGLKFDATAKVNGHVKVGYGDVDTDDGHYEDLLVEAGLNYRFDGKSNITLTASRKVETTADEFHENVLSHGVDIAYRLMFTPKVGMVMDVGLKNEEYRVNDSTEDRSDDIVAAGLAFNYTPRKWLNLGLRYVFTDRNSDVAVYEYQSNQVMGSVAFKF